MEYIMFATLDLTAYQYCTRCGNSADKDSKKCEICGTSDENEFIPITVSQNEEIVETIKNHTDDFTKELF